MTSTEIKATIAKHETIRPDPLKCLHPSAPRLLRAAWIDWCDRKRHLETQLGMALAEESSGWRDAMGNRVEAPITWRYGHGGFHNLQAAQASKKAEEMKLYRERRSSGLAKANGRPRSENPSKEALRCRTRREQKRARTAALDVPDNFETANHFSQH